MDINLWAVVASAVASMVIGSIWYGPLFGKPFIEAMGMNHWSPEKQAEMKKGMMWLYVGQFVASLVMFYVFARFFVGLGDLTLNGAIMLAFWVWIGFVVPIKLGEALWGGKWTLFWLGIGNLAVTLLATALIIGSWR